VRAIVECPGGVANTPGPDQGGIPWPIGRIGVRIDADYWWTTFAA
jgi:hypothetical protein